MQPQNPVILTKGLVVQKEVLPHYYTVSKTIYINGREYSVKTFWPKSHPLFPKDLTDNLKNLEVRQKVMETIERMSEYAILFNLGVDKDSKFKSIRIQEDSFIRYYDGKGPEITNLVQELEKAIVVAKSKNDEDKVHRLEVMLDQVNKSKDAWNSFEEDIAARTAPYKEDLNEFQYIERGSLPKELVESLSSIERPRERANPVEYSIINRFAGTHGPAKKEVNREIDGKPYGQIVFESRFPIAKGAALETESEFTKDYTPAPEPSAWQKLKSIFRSEKNDVEENPRETLNAQLLLRSQLPSRYGSAASSRNTSPLKGRVTPPEAPVPTPIPQQSAPVPPKPKAPARPPTPPPRNVEPKNEEPSPSLDTEQSAPEPAAASSPKGPPPPPSGPKPAAAQKPAAAPGKEGGDSRNDLLESIRRGRGLNHVEPPEAKPVAKTPPPVATNPQVNVMLQHPRFQSLQNQGASDDKDD